MWTKNYYTEQQQNNSLLWLKRGKWVTKCSETHSAPCTPGFLSTKENLPPGWNTHRHRGGSWASSQGKYGRCTDRYRVERWASLEPPITYMYIPGVQNVESMGPKCDERNTSSPFPFLIENTLLTSEKKYKNKLSGYHYRELM